jgi:hypothetical protein
MNMREQADVRKKEREREEKKVFHHSQFVKFSLQTRKEERSMNEISLHQERAGDEKFCTCIT